MVQSIAEHKMAIAAYRSENAIRLLNSTQFDLANKIVNVLEPIEEITKSISEDLAYISLVIPLIRALNKTFEQNEEDHDVCTMKSKMLKSLGRRFAAIKEKKVLVMATIIDPHFKDKFFSSPAKHRNAKVMLLSEYEEVRQQSEQDPCHSIESPSEKHATEEAKTKSKLWDCLSQILSETDLIASEHSNAGKVERFLAEPLLDFKTGSPYK